MKKTRHHLIPKSRRHDYKNKFICETSRVLILWEEKHKNWHHLFGNMTIYEIAECMLRIARIKGIKKRKSNQK